MIARRLFLGGLLAAATGPAIVRAASLMPIYVPRSTEIILPRWLERIDLGGEIAGIKKIWFNDRLIWECGK